MSQAPKTLAQLEARRQELAAQIDQVVAGLGSHNLPPDEQHRLEYQLLALEQENTGVVADWVGLRQQENQASFYTR